jgi:type III secretion protein W
MSRIDSSTFQNTPSFDLGMRQGGPGADGAALTGQLGGQKLAVDDGPSVLADAAEEISLHHSEKAEAKHSAERKKEIDAPLQLMSPEAIQAYLDAAQAYEDAEQLVQLAKRMLSGQGDPAAQARQAFGEPTSQYLALQYALQQGERDGTPADVLESLHEALFDLEMAHGPALRADINTIGTAAQDAGGPRDVAAFQATYRDVVLGDASLAGALRLALERFGGSDFASGLARLVQALGQDLAAARPSADPARLHSLVQDLYHLSVASTVLDGCGTLLDDQSRRHGTATDAGGGTVALMQDLVGVSSEKWVSSARLTALAEKHGARDPAPAIGFLTGVKVLLREMPVQVFVDADQRQGVFQATQEALDTAIDREEY